MATGSKQATKSNLGTSLGKNDTSWKPGESGNPNGRPITTVSGFLRKKGEAGGYEEIAAKLYQLAIKGDLGAIREWLDRTEGKVTDKLQVQGLVLVTTPDQLALAAQLFLEDAQKAKELCSGETVDGELVEEIR